MAQLWLIFLWLQKLQVLLSLLFLDDCYFWLLENNEHQKKKKHLGSKTVSYVSHNIIPATTSLCRREALVPSCALDAVFKLYCRIQNFCYIIDSDIVFFFNLENEANMKTVPTLASYPDIFATSSRVCLSCMDSLSLSCSTQTSGSFWWIWIFYIVPIDTAWEEGERVQGSNNQVFIRHSWIFPRILIVQTMILLCSSTWPAPYYRSHWLQPHIFPIWVLGLSPISPPPALACF